MKIARNTANKLSNRHSPVIQFTTVNQRNQSGVGGSMSSPPMANTAHTVPSSSSHKIDAVFGANVR